MPRNAKRRSSGKPRKPTRPCTYELGYVRQDLFACKKCSAENRGTRSGFCRGCMETCHADCGRENIIELYAKRAFRCDCGNNRDKITCQLCPNKDDMNVGNESVYSHNFENRYCRCDTPYNESAEMVQCAMCEDWFHEKCYKPAIPKNVHPRYDIPCELTCFTCVQKLPVLADYFPTLNLWTKRASSKKHTSHRTCIRPQNVRRTHRPGDYDYFWQPGFRAHLCRCPQCMDIYKAAKCLYIVDRNDFLNAAEPDDSDVLNSTDDAGIVQEIIDDDTRERSRIADSERIPRKPLPPRPEPSHVKQIRSTPDSLNPSQILSVRRRINVFLRKNINTNGGHLNRTEIMEYLSDLRKDLLNSIVGPLDGARDGQHQTT